MCMELGVENLQFGLLFGLEFFKLQWYSQRSKFPITNSKFQKTKTVRHHSMEGEP